MKLVRDRVFDRLISLEKGKVSSKISQLGERHKVGQSLTSLCIQNNEEEWSVSTTRRARSPNNKCLCVKRVWPMRRRVNLTSVLRSGITGPAPMTGFTGAVCYPTADSMIPARC
ncbi:hypothetical protein TNCV_2273451 [Trichonephila clavipes]|nr:hypothetical protein TNCV_2273451 [Trichonephila clavipes]